MLLCPQCGSKLKEMKSDIKRDDPIMQCKKCTWVGPRLEAWRKAAPRK
jgi:predicted RNA-binding Zn-ribbon protein involved in translation (DUF1610 family)